MRLSIVFALLLSLFLQKPSRVHAQDSVAASDTSNAVAIEEAMFEERPHFRVHTASATYWVDRSNGGLSKLIDSDGNDWIQYSSAPWDKYPASAASSYRGIPNAVFGGDHNGFGHPGWKPAETQRVGDRQLVTTSKDGVWQMTWTFTLDDATVAITKADPNRKYWFLYEGPIAGRWVPSEQYFATDTRAPVHQPKDYVKGDKFFETWKWAYFGDDSVSRVLAIVHEQNDELVDTFAHLGNTKDGLASPDGMVVFGFGRGPDGIEPLLTGENSFRIRFLEQSGKTMEQYEALKSILSH